MIEGSHLSLTSLLIHVVAQLALPLEARACLHTLVNKPLDNVTGMYIDGTEGDELLAVVLGELAVDDVDEVHQLGHLLVPDALQGLFVALLKLIKGLIDLLCEEETGHYDGILDAVVKQPSLAGLFVVGRNCIPELHRQGVAHGIHHILQPGLNNANNAHISRNGQLTDLWPTCQLIGRWNWQIGH
eukprot:scaffold281563_cov46-Prasinocladus_malaysianus.AAC.2